MAWIRRLVQTLERHRWTCVAFAQLSTHVHLIVAVADWSLPLGMKLLNAEYSKDFNARHDRVGQFVRRRYGSRRIADGRDLVGTFVYVALNPVEAGLAPRPEDWRWSSYATTIGLSGDFPFVDASLVLGEAGSVDRLREIVAAEQAARLARRATSGV
jgi:REP element-mobilizing transposase RayT